MTGMLGQVLDERASAVAVPVFDTEDLVARGSRRVVRRRVALAVGLSFVVVPGSDQEPMPVAPPGPTQTGLQQHRVVPDAAVEDAVPLAPGTWSLRGTGASSTRLVGLDVPAGFRGSGNQLLASGGGVTRTIAYWAPVDVLGEPCANHDVSRRTPVRTAAEMAAALTSQPRSTVTRPRPVSIDGYDGLTLRLSVDVDPRTCPDKVFYVFGTATFDHWVSHEGDTERYWILDVDGEVLLLSVTTAEGASQVQAAELAGIVESARFAADD